MKNIVYFIFCFALVAFTIGCSDDEPGKITGSLALSSNDESVEIGTDARSAIATIDPEGSSVNITVSSSESWDVVRDQSDSWVNYTVNNNTLTLSADEFNSDWTRTATIKIDAGKAGTARINVVQDGTDVARLSIDPGFAFFPEWGGTADIYITTNMDEWQVTGYENLSWLSVELHDDYFTLTATQNYVAEDVTEYLTVTAGSGENTAKRELPVTIREWTEPYLYIAGHSNLVMALPEYAVSLDIPIEKNRAEWDVSYNSTWFTVEKSGDNVIIQSSAGNTQQTGTISLLIYDEGEVADTFVLTVTRFIDYMELQVSPYANETVAMPVEGNVNIFVDWGNGNYSTQGETVSAYGDDQAWHKYTTTGVYNVRLYGYVPSLHGGFERQRAISGILKWADLQTTHMVLAFSNTSLQYIAPLGDFSMENVEELYMMFYGCEQLEEIPADLFQGASKPESFTGIFFGCSNLKNIPEGLFDDCTSAHDFSSCFRDCTRLTTVPEGLFDNSPNVTSFLATFWNCYALQTVPVDIFSQNTKVVDFSGTFAGCSNWEGESPYSSVNGNKVHLYERSAYPGVFSAPSNYQLCFYGCTDLDDYANIPADWRTE